MIITMGICASVLAVSYFFNDNKIENNIIEEIEQIKINIQKCEEDFTKVNEMKQYVPVKLNILKNKINKKDKLYDMLLILEDEWNHIENSIRIFENN